MLTVSQLSLERYFQPVFQPVDFTLPSGELLVVTGDNGSGKTTLIRLLAGILSASSGKISNLAQSTAYLGHALAIKEDLSVLENLRFVWNYHGKPAIRPEQALDEVGLHRVAEQTARTLSAGQRKRCALARLLLVPSQLWLLDEPYANLDDQGIALVDSLLKRHCEDGGACVAATHGHHRPEILHLQELQLTSGYSA